MNIQRLKDFQRNVIHDLLEKMRKRQNLKTETY